MSESETEHTLREPHEMRNGWHFVCSCQSWRTSTWGTGDLTSALALAKAEHAQHIADALSPIGRAAQVLSEFGYIDLGMHDDLDDWMVVAKDAVEALRRAGWTVEPPDHHDFVAP